jgi:hypothetical protein
MMYITRMQNLNITLWYGLHKKDIGLKMYFEYINLFFCGVDYNVFWIGLCILIVYIIAYMYIFFQNMLTLLKCIF